MGLLSSLFGSKTTTKNDVLVDPKYQQFLDQNLSKAGQAFNQPFQKYSGDRISGFTQDELKGFDLTRAFSDPSKNFGYQMEQDALRKFGAPPSLNQLQPYMNPFTEGVLDRATNRLTDSFDTQLANARGSSLGALGGSRQAVLESEMTDNFLTQVGDMRYQGLSDAFDRGQSTYYKTGIDAFNLAGLSQGRELDRANALLNIGGTQRSLDQAGADFDHSEFMRQITEPKNDSLSLAQIGSAYPTQIFDTKSTVTQTPSIMDAIVQGAGAVMSIAGGFPGLGGMGKGAPPSAGANPFLAGGSSAPSWAPAPITGSGGSFGTMYGGSSSGLTFKDGGLVQKFADGGIVNYRPRLKEQGRRDGAGFKKFLEADIPTRRNMVRNLFGIESERPEIGSETSFDRILSSYDYRKRLSKVFKNPFGIPEKPDEKYVISERPTQQQQDQPAEIVDLLSGGMPSLAQPELQPSTPVQTQQQDEPQKDWYDRWVDNPLTKLGLQLMSGGNNVAGRSASRILDDDRYSDAEKTRQRELETNRDISAEQDQYSRTQDAEKLKLAWSELEETKNKNESEYKADMARTAQMRSEGRDNRIYSSLTQQKNEAMQSIYGLQKAKYDAMATGGLKADPSLYRGYDKAVSDATLRLNDIDRQLKSLYGGGSTSGTDPAKLRE